MVPTRPDWAYGIPRPPIAISSVGIGEDSLRGLSRYQFRSFWARRTAATDRRSSDTECADSSEGKTTTPSVLHRTAARTHAPASSSAVSAWAGAAGMPDAARSVGGGNVTLRAPSVGRNAADAAGSGSDEAAGAASTPDAATCLMSIGVFHYEQGNNLRSLDSWKRALKVYEAIGAATTPSAATCLMSIGTVHYDHFDNKRALDHFKRSLKVYEAIGATLS